jgi:hypothetical protein
MLRFELETFMMLLFQPDVCVSEARLDIPRVPQITTCSSRSAASAADTRDKLLVFSPQSQTENH